MLKSTSVSLFRMVGAFIFLLSVICLLTSGVNFAEASTTVTLVWDANNESDVAGYRVHYGTSSGNHQYSVDVGNNTSCTISGLNEGTTYYLAATAYDNSNNESNFSEEISHTIPNPPPPPPPPPADTDADGITDNDEINIYGTDPENADTDGDGMNDGEELEYWGGNWNADSDGDQIINLLDVDPYIDLPDSNSTLDITDVNPANYTIAPLNTGDTYYIDRNYIITEMPAELEGLMAIHTANNDKSRQESEFLTFYVNQDINLYVAYDARATRYPDWLTSSYTNTGMTIDTTDIAFTVWKKEFVAGSIALPGNIHGNPVGVASNYFVFLKPLPLAPVDTDADGITDNDEINIYGTDPENADTDGDGMNDGEELEYWGGNWNADSDGDQIINLLDVDPYIDLPDSNSTLDITDVNPANYTIAPLNTGDTYYIDRNYIITEMPAELEGLMAIHTANNDKSRQESEFLTFYVNQDINLYVAYDARATRYPDWLTSSYTNTGMTIDTTDIAFTVWKKEFVAGSIALPGNIHGNPVGVASNYFVFLKPLPLAPVDTDADGITDNDEINIYGTDPENADTDGDGMNDGEELEYWGGNWNADSDGDQIINLLDVDPYIDLPDSNSTLDITDVNPANYTIAPLNTGDTYYIDRNYIITEMPAELEGLMAIHTANNDKSRQESEFLTFYVNQDINLYVAYDARATRYPDWLTSSYTNTGLTIDTTDIALTVWQKEFVAGSIALPGNIYGNPVGAESNYFVLIDSME